MNCLRCSFLKIHRPVRFPLWNPSAVRSMSRTGQSPSIGVEQHDQENCGHTRTSLVERAIRLGFVFVMIIACIRLSSTTAGISASPILSNGQEQNGRGVGKNDRELTLSANQTNSPSGSADGSDRHFFRRIMIEVAHRDYEAGAAGFRLFLELHPTSSLFTQADYWLGECEYQLGHYRAAIDALDHALSRTPFHPSLAAAVLLRKANIFADLGDVGQSRRLLELIVVEFPATEEAAQARERLLLQQRPF